MKAGCRCGADPVFFNIDAYFRFVDDVSKAGAQIPIIPGIMPIINSTQLMRFRTRLRC